MIHRNDYVDPQITYVDPHELLNVTTITIDQTSCAGMNITFYFRNTAKNVLILFVWKGGVHALVLYARQWHANVIFADCCCIRRRTNVVLS